MAGGAAVRAMGRSRLALALAALAFLADGVGTQAMGLALPALIAEWHLPRAAFAAPTALGLVGFALGAFGGGVAGDRFGPLRAVLGALLLMGLATAGCALARDVPQLGAWRLLAGLGLGASLPIAASLIAAHAPAEQRSFALAAGLAFLPVGGFAAGFAAAAILPDHGWRGLFMACGAFSVALCVLGALSLPRMRRAGDVGGAAMPPRDRGPHGNAAGKRISPLHPAADPRDSLGLAVAFFFTVLLYYSMFSWAPTALSAAGLALPVVSHTLAVFSAGGLVGGVLAGLAVQRVGSRACLAVLGIATIACALALPGALGAAARTLGPLTAAVGLLGVSVIGIQSLLYALGAQLYPIEHRTRGLGMAVGCGRLGAIASSYTGVLTLDRGGTAGFCGSLALAGLLTVAAGLAVSRQIRVS